MSSDIPKDPPESSLSQEDFREFIDSVLEANTTGKRIAEHVNSVLFLNLTSPIAKSKFLQDYTRVVERLLKERRNLNAKYGWVVASSADLVAKAMGRDGSNGTDRTRRWMRTVFEEYERVGVALVDAAQALGAGQWQT